MQSFCDWQNRWKPQNHKAFYIIATAKPHSLWMIPMNLLQLTPKLTSHRDLGGRRDRSCTKHHNHQPPHGNVYWNGFYRVTALTWVSVEKNWPPGNSNQFQMANAFVHFIKSVFLTLSLSHSLTLQEFTNCGCTMCVTKCNFQTSYAQDDRKNDAYSKSISIDKQRYGQMLLNSSIHFVHVEHGFREGWDRDFEC